MKFNLHQSKKHGLSVLLFFVAMPVLVNAQFESFPNNQSGSQTPPASVIVPPANVTPPDAASVPVAGVTPPDAVNVPAQGNGGTFGIKNPLDPKFNSIGGLVKGFVEIFSIVAVLFATLALIWVGFRFILARGDSTKMNELKDWLMYIVIGVAVVIGARVIIQVVINTLSATGTVNQGVIQNVQKAVNGQ